MDFHGKFSMEFHGGLGHQFPWNSMEIYLHGGLGHFPWNSMENIRAPISMEFHGNFCIDIFHGGLGHFLWNSMESSMQFHRNYSIDYSMDLQGVSWNSQE